MTCSKSKPVWSIFLWVALALSFSSCGGRLEREKTAIENEIKASIQTVDRQIEILQNTLEEAGEGASEDIKAQIESLRQDRTALQNERVRVRQSTQADWKNLKLEARKKVDEITSKLEDIGK